MSEFLSYDLHSLYSGLLDRILDFEERTESTHELL